MYCEGTADILDAYGCQAATHVFIYTHTPRAADSLQPRDGTQWVYLNDIYVWRMGKGNITLGSIMLWVS